MASIKESDGLAFARKYRPNTLARYVGNAKNKTAVMAELNRAKKPQSFLLTGASGCGKTTLARLIGKEYNCENRSPETGACNECISCKQMDDYILTGDTSSLSNIFEINIADQSGKKDLNSILDEMAIPGYGDEWKIFIFDECHMATPQAQNMMLKIVEEPPERVLMIFCTTNPEKMIETLVNRCQVRLEIRKPSVKDLSGLLGYVCKCEDLNSDIKGLNFIANRSNLTIRDALSSLERVVTECGDAHYESAIKVFEEVSDKLIADFFDKLTTTRNGRRDITGYVSLLYNIKAQTSLKVFVNDMAAFLKRGIYVVNQINIDGVSDEELITYRRLFGDFKLEQLAYLLLKVLDMQDGDIETKLLLLGYTGIESSNSDIAGKKLDAVEDKIDSNIASSLSELSRESAQASLNRNESSKEKEKEFMDKTSEYFKPASIEDIQSEFGCTTVTDL